MHRRSLNRFLLSAAAFAAAGSTLRSTADASPDRYAVHEWGTFTTFQGSRGAVIEGLHHEEEALPSFVHSVTDGLSGTVIPLATPAPVHTCGKGLPCSAKISHVTTKMETPVIYFHTDRPRSVRVHVDFENGLLSQFYPAARLDGFRAGDDANLSQIRRTSLEWQLDLVPDPKDVTIPQVGKDEPWQLAREVSAASVKTGSGEGERYVFYRGLGRLDLPVAIIAEGKGVVVVKNGGVAGVPAAFLLEMTPQGGRFAELGKLAAGESRTASFGRDALRSREDVVDALETRVLSALVAEGLYEDEALAMVRTWSRSWFGNEGTRLVYLVPRSLTDAVLPLSIEPAPAELVRVLVGRLEFLTPETEREAEHALRDAYGQDPSKTKAAQARLDRFGRFLEPVARRIAATTRHPEARVAAQGVVSRAGMPDVF